MIPVLTRMLILDIFAWTFKQLRALRAPGLTTDVEEKAGSDPASHSLLCELGAISSCLTTGSLSVMWA